MRQAFRPYQVLAALWFNRFDWVVRHPNGVLTFPTGQFAQELGLRTSRLRDCLETLVTLGLIRGLRWHSHWAYLQLSPPPGMAWMVGPVVDALAPPVAEEPAHRV